MKQSVFINTVIYLEHPSDNELNEKGHPNYIDLSEGNLYTYDGAIAIPEELLKIILKHYKRSCSQWLLPNSVDGSKPLTATHFTKMFNSIFKEKISTNYIRKLHTRSGMEGGDEKEQDSGVSEEEHEKKHISSGNTNDGVNRVAVATSLSDVECMGKEEGNDFIYFEKVKVSSRILVGAKIKMDKEDSCLVIL